MRPLRPVCPSLLLGLSLCVAMPARAAAEDPAAGTAVPAAAGLTVGFAEVLRMDGNVDTIVLGDPAVADASPLDPRTILLTGLAAGTTNMIVLGADGQVLAEMLLRVSARQPGTVTVRRALQTQTYSCGSGLCEGSPAGDAPPAASAPAAPSAP